MKELKLKDIKKKLIGFDNADDIEFQDYSARYMREEKRVGYPDDMFSFFEVLCSILPDNVTMDEFLLNIELLINDLENEECGFHNSSITEIKFKNLNERLKAHKDLPQVMSFIPRYIDEVADSKFSIEFSKRYGEEVLGQYGIEELDIDYGYIEIDENSIDISNKDKAEVLAKLYNNSKPVGMGMAQYDPTPMTTEIAKKLLERETQYSYILGRPLYINLSDNILWVGAYNRDNGKGLAQRVISSCRNINDLGKGKIKSIESKLEEEIQEKIEQEIEKKHREKMQTQQTSNNTRGSRLDYLRVSESELQPTRRLIEETGEGISEETLRFIKSVENEAYPEEMKLMQDIDDIEELEDIYEYYLDELTVARNNDWYIIYGEDEDAVEIVDIASLPTRDRVASQEIHNYLTRVINQKAHNDKKPVTLNAREETSYRMIQRMVANGEYEILEDEQNTWDNNTEIVMHNLVLRPVIQRDIGGIE